ncbi:MAG: tetratricopeptide repeat protein [Ktedonobacteraceae bacterium]
MSLEREVNSMKNPMPTPCPDWEEKLVALHPDDLSSEELEAFNTHLASCQTCTTVLANYREMDSLICSSLTINRPIKLWEDVEENTDWAWNPNGEVVRRPGNQLLLRCAHSLLKDGDSDQAFSTLEKIRPETEKQHQERMYLLGWCFIHQKRWSDAIQTLSPLCNFPSTEEKRDPQDCSGHEGHAYSLLWLGHVAVNTYNFEEAARHYRDCLQVLQKQQLPLRSVQIKASYGLATTNVMRGLHSAACQYYLEALKLCRDVVDDENRADIYYGLCYTYRMMGKLLQAHDVGNESLRLYKELANPLMEGEIRNVLGRISYLLGDYRTASEHYTEALTIAISHERRGMIMANYAALADLRLAEDQLEEAKRYCLLAQEIAEGLDKDYLSGLTYLVTGKVIEVEAQRAAYAKRKHRRLLEKASENFGKAKELLSRTQAYSDIEEVNWRLAAVLEKLVS